MCDNSQGVKVLIIPPLISNKIKSASKKMDYILISVLILSLSTLTSSDVIGPRKRFLTKL